MKKSDRLGHIQAWKRSGQTRPVYCEAHRLDYGTFLSWFHSDDQRETSGHFIPLPLPDNTGTHIEIGLPNGVKIIYHGELTDKILQSLRHV